jgi:antitoxin (DNA-binding transcriptional repressor) of toxin-antitoxin stability system
MKMGLREANQNFSKAIKAVKAGEAIILTERGKAIATIRPIKRETGQGDELQPLRDEGFLMARPKTVARRSKAKPPLISGLSISEVLRRERDED